MNQQHEQPPENTKPITGTTASIAQGKKKINKKTKKNPTTTTTSLCTSSHSNVYSNKSAKGYYKW